MAALLRNGQARSRLLEDGTPLESISEAQHGQSSSSLGAPQDTSPLARPSPPSGPDCRGVSPQQLHGEYLTSDPDWTGGCWLTSYMRLHHLLIERAEDINSEGRTHREDASRSRGEDTPSISESLRMLRREVFSLTPLKFLGSGVAVSFALTVLSFLAPAVSGMLVDSAVDLWNDRSRGIVRDIWPELTWHLILYGVLLITSYCCEIAVGILFAIAGHTTVTRLRIKLFRNLTRQEIGFYDMHVSGELSSRLINDSASLSNLTQFTTQTFLGAMVKFIGSLVSMYWTHPMLALISTFITPLNLLLVRRTGHIVGYYGVVQNDGMAKANAVSVEVLGSIRTVQSNVGEAMEANRFMEKMNYFLRVIKATVYVETVLRFTSYGLSKTRDIVIIAVAMHQVATGTLSIGSYTAFAQYVSLYESGFNNIIDIWLNFKQTITSTGKFVQLLLREPRIPMTGGLEPESCAGSLSFENVTFAYSARPDHDVLKGVSITAVPGTIIALVGESGAGKTTLGRLLQRHYDPRGGRVLLDGRDYRSLSLRWLRTQIGVVEQEPVLFDRPICQNIAYGSAECKTLEDVQAAARLANADDFISQMDKAYFTHPGERACRMSGGQKQRVAIARAVVRDPKVLLLDEATSALDGTNEHIVQAALDSLMVGKTTVIIAHRLSTVVRATKIMVLEKGVVIEEGSHDELVAGNTKYASFMKHQLVAPILQ